MMKKNYFKFVLIAAAAFMSMGTMVSCSDSDDDDDNGGNGGGGSSTALTSGTLTLEFGTTPELLNMADLKIWYLDATGEVSSEALTSENTTASNLNLMKAYGSISYVKKFNISSLPSEITYAMECDPSDTIDTSSRYTVVKGMYFRFVGNDNSSYSYTPILPSSMSLAGDKIADYLDRTSQRWCGSYIIGTDGEINKAEEYTWSCSASFVDDGNLSDAAKTSALAEITSMNTVLADTTLAKGMVKLFLEVAVEDLGEDVYDVLKDEASFVNPVTITVVFTSAGVTDGTYSKTFTVNTNGSVTKKSE